MNFLLIDDRAVGLWFKVGDVQAFAKNDVVYHVEREAEVRKTNTKRLDKINQ